jgi:hypothetical protein
MAAWGCGSNRSMQHNGRCVSGGSVAYEAETSDRLQRKPEGTDVGEVVQRRYASSNWPIVQSQPLVGARSSGADGRDSACPDATPAAISREICNVPDYRDGCVKATTCGLRQRRLTNDNESPSRRSSRRASIRALGTVPSVRGCTETRQCASRVASTGTGTGHFASKRIGLHASGSLGKVTGAESISDRL